MEKAAVVASVILFSADIFLSSHALPFLTKITVRKDHMLRCNPFSIPNATETCHSSAFTDILLFTQQISPLACSSLAVLLLTMAIVEGIAVRFLLSGLEEKCLFQQQGSPTFLFPWHSIKYQYLFG